MEVAMSEMDRASEGQRFFAIQIARYLASRPQHRFSGRCEYDAVKCLISDTWVELCCSGGLDGLSRQGREALYFNTIIVFPGYVADGFDSCIPVDFVTGTRICVPMTQNSAPQSE